MWKLQLLQRGMAQNRNRKKNTNCEYLLFTCTSAFICRRTEIVKASSKTVIIIVVIIIIVVAVIIIAIIIINIDRVVCGGGDVERRIPPIGIIKRTLDAKRSRLRAHYTNFIIYYFIPSRLIFFFEHFLKPFNLAVSRNNGPSVLLVF